MKATIRGTAELKNKDKIDFVYDSEDIRRTTSIHEIEGVSDKTTL